MGGWSPSPAERERGWGEGVVGCAWLLVWSKSRALTPALRASLSRCAGEGLLEARCFRPSPAWRERGGGGSYVWHGDQDHWQRCRRGGGRGHLPHKWCPSKGRGWV